MSEIPNNILNSQYSIKFVIEKLRESTKNEHSSYENLHRYEAKDIAGGSAFFSKIFQIKFFWKDDVEGLPKSVVFKAVSAKNMKAMLAKDCDMEIDENLVNMLNEFIPKAHKSELFFYRTFPVFDPSIKVPNFFYGSEFTDENPEGILIIGDLSENGATLKMLPGLDNEQIEAVIDELAHIHSLAWKHPDFIDFYRDQFKTFDKILDMVQANKDMAQKLREIKPDVFNPLLDRSNTIFTIETWSRHFYVENKYGFPACLVHTDLWSPNILFEKDSNNNKVTSNLLGIIDWQICCPGNPCGDIARLLGLNTSAKYRREHTERILKRYMNKVIEFMDGKEFFSYEQVHEAYQNSLGYVMMFIAYGAPMYFNLPFVVEGPEKENNRKELLSRVACFFEDALIAFGL